MVGRQHYRRLRQVESAWEEIALTLESRQRLREFSEAPGRTHSLDEVLAENGLTDAELES